MKRQADTHDGIPGNVHGRSPASGHRTLKNFALHQRLPTEKSRNHAGNILHTPTQTAIDALAVGFSLSLLGIEIWTPAITIGIITAALTVSGMLLGRKIGTIWGGRVEILGGLVLITISLKILLKGG